MVTIHLVLRDIINTRRKFLIWTILFVVLVVIFAYYQDYFPFCSLGGEYCGLYMIGLPLFLAVILSLLIDWVYDKRKKK